MRAGSACRSTASSPSTVLTLREHGRIHPPTPTTCCALSRRCSRGACYAAGAMIVLSKGGSFQLSVSAAGRPAVSRYPDVRLNISLTGPLGGPLCRVDRRRCAHGTLERLQVDVVQSRRSGRSSAPARHTWESSARQERSRSKAASLYRLHGAGGAPVGASRPSTGGAEMTSTWSAPSRLAFARGRHCQARRLPSGGLGSARASSSICSPISRSRVRVGLRRIRPGHSEDL